MNAPYVDFFQQPSKWAAQWSPAPGEDSYHFAPTQKNPFAGVWIYDQGYINACMRLDAHTAQLVTAVHITKLVDY